MGVGGLVVADSWGRVLGVVCRIFEQRSARVDTVPGQSAGCAAIGTEFSSSTIFDVRRRANKCPRRCEVEFWGLTSWCRNIRRDD